MAGPVFKYQIKIDPSPVKLAALIGGLGKEFNDWRPAWRRLAPHMAAGIAENFQTQGGAIGESWPPLTDRYVTRKARGGGGRATLVLSGKLLAEATSPQGVVSMTGIALRFGTSIPYSRAMNFGFTPKGGRGGVPRRPFMGWNQNMKDAALEAMNDHASDLLDRAAKRIDELRAAGGR